MKLKDAYWKEDADCFGTREECDKYETCIPCPIHKKLLKGGK